jgi:hypothetical protein
VQELAARWEKDDLKDSGQASPYTTAAAVENLIGWVDAMLAARKA